MMITAQMLSIPPYISTPWKNISSLHATPENNLFKLIVVFNNGVQVAIPNLDQATIDAVFKAHAQYGSSSVPTNPMQGMPPGSIALPLDGSPELFNAAMQHNPAQANAPEIPHEVLEKIASIAKVLGLDSALLPKAEPHCNCPFCQLARSLSGEVEAKIEEPVSDKDLQFRTWEIKQTADKLYTVSLDDEQYSVFLGEPIGCTCGKKNCDHIRAVLNS